MLIYDQDERLETIYVLLEDEREFTEDRLSGCLSLILTGEGVFGELPGQTARLRGLVTYSHKYFK